MNNLPDLRSNLGTWAIPDCWLPAVAALLRQQWHTEDYDPQFQGQYLQTTYFDTPDFDLRRARRKGDQYLTLRLRCYRTGSAAGGDSPEETYALSAKTESEKFRQEIGAGAARWILDGSPSWLDLLPANLQARLLALAEEADLQPVVTVCARRYAVENDQERLTLDVAIQTDTGKRLPYSVLEFKSADADQPPPDLVQRLRLRPIKLSKFLWATRV
jgi:hypothetical protein